MGLTEYIEAAMATARFRVLEDGTWYGEIPGLRGVYSDAKTLKQSRVILREVLEDWLVFKLWNAEPLPAVRGRRLALPALARA
jgi:predicted RNase H-like HicB family nuclease